MKSERLSILTYFISLMVINKTYVHYKVRWTVELHCLTKTIYFNGKLNNLFITCYCEDFIRTSEVQNQMKHNLSAHSKIGWVSNCDSC